MKEIEPNSGIGGVGSIGNKRLPENKRKKEKEKGNEQRETLLPRMIRCYKITKLVYYHCSKRTKILSDRIDAFDIIHLS